MKVVKVQFHKLDKEYFFLPEFSEASDLDIEVGDSVVVETSLGKDVGRITDWAEWEAPKSKDKKDHNTKGPEHSRRDGDLVQEEITDVKPMLRPLSEKDLDVLRAQKKETAKKVSLCKQLIHEHGLKAMKLVDMSESYDNKRMTFYFTSDSRVDFRGLVKDLVGKYHKKIRLQQVGVRDAAMISGDIGSCGMPLCCKAWLNTIGSVSPDSIKNQELSHRGSDRLTGPCGRLKCCLRFEDEAYKYSRDKMPKVGDSIKTKLGVAEVIAVHPIKQTVNLRIDGNIVEYPYLEGKLCENKDDCDK